MGQASHSSLDDEVSEGFLRKSLSGVPLHAVAYDRAVVVQAVQIVLYGPSLGAVVDIHDSNYMIGVGARAAAGLYDVQNDVESPLPIGEKRVPAQNEPSKFPGRS
jgi:hypothetical protein